jgi:hypothetical protein
MSDWKQAVVTRKSKIDNLNQLIPGYNYSTRGYAQRTDDGFSSLMIANLRICKKRVFDILDTAFSLQRDLLLKDFERLRNEIDTFSDEIKARAFKWDTGKTRPWLERLVDYDYRILTDLGNLYKGIEALHDLLLDSNRSVSDLKALDRETRKLQESLDSLVLQYRERELVCNISEAVLEKNFRAMVSKIRKGI